MSKNETNSESFLRHIGALAKKLEAGGFDPVLVGGMALMLLGSERITKDFDFVVSQHQERIKELIGIFYIPQQDCELMCCLIFQLQRKSLCFGLKR